VTKYHSKKVTINGIKFDSKREASRYLELMQLSKAGEITGLTLQVPFVLAPAVRFASERRKKPAMVYRADFVYSDVRLGAVVVEDVKGVETPEFRIKRHLMLSVHGIDVKVTR